MIQLIGLKKKYISQKGVETEALKDVSLEVDNGLTFIVGQTGCGKSTLLNLLGRLDTSYEGEIFVDGVELNSLTQKQSTLYRNQYVGCIFQEYNLIEELTVLENVRLANDLQAKKEDENIFVLFEKLGLNGLENKYPDELSGGQKQRVAIARALIKNPKLLLADEPTGALDLETGKEILEILVSISKEIPVLVVSHNLEYAKQYANRIIELSNGIVVSDTNQKEQKKEQKQSNSLYTAIEKKSKGLGLKGCLRFVKINFGTRIKRLISMVLVSVLLFSIAGVVFTSFFFNKSRVLTNTVHENKASYLTVMDKGLKDYDGLDILEMYPSALNISSYEVQKIKKLTGRIAYPVFSDFGDVYTSLLASSWQEDPNGFKQNFGNNGEGLSWEKQSLYYQVDLMGGMEIDPKIAKALDISLIEGRYPETNLEIAVSEYAFELFWYYGYKIVDSAGETKVENILTISDLIGKTIKLADKKFTITGVLNVGGTKAFEPLKDLSQGILDEDSEYKALSESWETERHASLNTVLFVCPDYYAEVLRTAYETRTFAQGSSFLTYQKKDTESSNVYGNITAFAPYSNTKGSLSAKIIWKNGKKESLTDNQIILKIDPSKMEEYRINGKLFADIFAEKEVNKETISPYVENIFNDFSSIYFWDQIVGFHGKAFEVVGIYCDEQNTSIALHVSDQAYEQLIDYCGLYEYEGAFLPLSGGSGDYEVIRKINESKEFRFADKYSFEISRMSRLMGLVLEIGSVIAVVCILICGLLLGNYISIVIDDKRRQIGILRLLGASKKTLFGIFGTEGGVLAFIVAVFSSLGAWGLGVFADVLVRKYYHYTLTLISIGIWEILLIFGLALLVGFIASFIPVCKAEKKNPIDCLKN